MIKERCNLIGQEYILPLRCKPEFSQIQGLHWKTQNCSVFHVRLRSAKINGNIVLKLKELHFVVFWPVLGRTKVFLKNLLSATFSWF